ncbi:hypothetical protein ACHAWT_000146 [Skeletonema menzelii]
MDRRYPTTTKSRSAAAPAGLLRRQQSSGSNSFFDEPNAQQQQQQPRGSPSRIYDPKKNQYTKQRAPAIKSSSPAVDRIDRIAGSLFNFLTASKFNILGLITLVMTIGNVYGRFQLGRDPEESETFVAMRRFRLGGNHAMQLPSDWDTWTLSDFKHEFLCHHHFNKETYSMYTWDQWNTLRKTFNEAVDPTFNFNTDPVPPTKGYSFQVTGNAPPFYADQTARGAPGLFASRRITKGELVFDGTHSDVTFPDAHAFRKFMFALPKKDIACDVTKFIWSQRLKEDGPMHIMAAFNIATYVNDAYEAEKEVNVLPREENSLKLYATTDIEKGDEILTHFEHYDADWDEVGLGH